KGAQRKTNQREKSHAKQQEHAEGVVPRRRTEPAHLSDEMEYPGAAEREAGQGRHEDEELGITPRSPPADAAQRNETDRASERRE
ncbi:MAG TPA: hypothetical protein VNM48_07505, partial [Chloroflexota bacterium]|nr:hypothetical protein [Chloroflexota bacterium]